MSRLTVTGKDLKKKYPDNFKELEKAMEMTNGKVDNTLAKELVSVEGITAKEIAKLAGKYVCDPYFCNRIWNVENYGKTKESRKRERKEKREENFNEKFRYNFKDTFLYRKLQNETGNLNDDILEDYCEDVEYSLRIGRSIADAPKYRSNKFINKVIYFLKIDKELRNKIISSKLMLDIWFEHAYIEKYVEHPYWLTEEEKAKLFSLTDKEYREAQQQRIYQDFSGLVHAPDNIKRELQEYEDFTNRKKHLYYGQSKSPVPLSIAILRGSRIPGSDKSVELAREAFDTLEYLGIGVCWNCLDRVGKNKEAWDNILKLNKDEKRENSMFRDCNSQYYGKGTTNLLKKISSSMRKFGSCMKKGFQAEDVREIIIDDLNQYSKDKAENNWKFYARTDAKDEYDEFPKSKKKVKQIANNLSNKSNLDVNENEPSDAEFVEFIKKVANSKE